MPRSDENVIILESDDDDDVLSGGDKDDVVFVNMTPVGLRPSKIKSYLTPISIDSDEDDDDIIFVSATAGKHKKSHIPLSTVDDAVSVLQSVTSLEQTLSSLQQTVNAASVALTIQPNADDVLAPTEDEPLVIQPLPKLPPAQPSFHDNDENLADSLVVETLPPTSAPGDVDATGSINAVDDSRLHGVDTGVGALSAFLAGDVNQTPDTCVGLGLGQTGLGPWDDSSSAQQGLLAWLRDLTVPSNITTPLNTTMHVADLSKPDTNAVAGPALPTTSSPSLTSFQTIDNLLSPSVVTSSTNASCSWAPSSVSSSSLYSSPGSVTKSFLSTRPFLNPAPSSLQNLGPDARPAWLSIYQSMASTSGNTNLGSDSNNNNTSIGTYVPPMTPQFSSIPPPSSSSSSSSSPLMTITSATSIMQFSSGITMSHQPVARISPRQVTPPPMPSLTSLSPTSSLPLGPSALVSSSVSTTFTSPSRASVGSIPSTSSTSRVPVPVRAADVAASLVSAITPLDGDPGRGAMQSHRPALFSQQAKHSSAPHTQQPKHNASYMQTHPSNIPLKKRRRHQHPAQQRDGGTEGREAGEADSSKCSWCKLMVPYNNLSHCMQGHPCCADCLQYRAKALLSKSKRGTLKCPYASCVSYFPMSQLQRTLPPMVVEILEEKLDQEYVNYADDLLWHNIGEGADGETAAEEDDGEEDDEDGLSLGSERPGFKQPAFPQLPVFWEPMDDSSSSYKLVELSSENIEYIEVSCLFNETMRTQATISRILRIQNPILWQFYNVKKLQLQESNDGRVLEKQLLHGTSNSVVDAICKTNFDWRLCGAHGTMYGQGTYFARDAAYSHVYTDNARNRTLQNPGHILAMLSKNRKVRANLCLKRLAGSGSIGLGVVSSPTSTNYLNVQTVQTQPPPAHWRQQAGLLQNLWLPQDTVVPPAVPLGPLPAATNNNNSSSNNNNNNLQLRMNTMAPTTTIGSTGNSGLNLSMRTSPLILALHRHANHLTGQQSSMGPVIPPPVLPPPPAHQRRHPNPGCSGVCGGAHHQCSLAQSLSGSPLPGKWRTLLINDASTSSSSNSSSLAASASASASASAPGSLPSSSSSVSSSSMPGSSGSGTGSSHQKRPVHSMFVAKVLVGRYTVGQNHYRKPPPLDQSDPYGPAYDSCVDNLTEPKIYVVFDSAQCYPEYVIEYTSNNLSCYM